MLNFTDEEISEILGNTAEKHLKWVESEIPNFAALEINIDIHFLLYNKVLHKGKYYIPAGEYKQTDNIYIYTLNFNYEELAKQAENIKEIKANLEPIKVDKNKCLEYKELLFNCAIEDAIISEDTNLRSTLILTLYGWEILEETPQEKEYLKQDTQIVTKRLKALDKVSNPKIISQITTSEEKNIRTGGKAEGDTVKTVIRFENPKPELFKGLAEPIYSAIASIYSAGGRNITYSDIAKAAFNVDKPTEKQIKTVIKNCKEMASTLVEIDYSGEIRGAENITEYKHAENVLYAEFDTFKTANGKTAGGIKIIKEPILIRHARDVKQLTTIDIKMLKAASKKVSSTKTNVLIREYLLREIERLKRTKNKRMQYTSIFAAADITEPTKTEKNRLRNTIKDYLQVFKDEKHIKDFKEYKTGRSITGIELKF